MIELWIAQDLCNLRSVVLDRPNYPTHTGMSPDYGYVRVPFEKSFHFVQVCGLRVFLGEGNIHVAVNQYDQPDVCGKIKNPVESWVLKTCDFSGDFCRHEFLMNRKLPNAGKYAREGLKHTADVIHGVHV